MKAFWAIVRQTIRSSVRAKVFHLLSLLILLAVFLLPLTVSGDGTLNGLVQISLSYSLSIVIVLISTATLWLSCSQLSREIENYTIHLGLTKPCPRWKLWLGKWVGIFSMHASILIVAMVAIFVLIQARIYFAERSGRFSKEEVATLDKEIRVGRRTFHYDRSSLREKVIAEYEKTKEKYAGKSEIDAKNEIYFKMMKQKGVIQPGEAQKFIFKNVKGKGDLLFLRYRIYSGSTTETDQRDIPGIWGIKDPNAPAGVQNSFVFAPVKFMGGTYQELKITPYAIDKANDSTVTVTFINPRKEDGLWVGEPAAAVIQPGDGPTMMIAVASFTENYLRSMLLALIQIAFLAALGCTVSAAFSTPVAAFAAISYLLIGLTVNAALDAPLKNDAGHFIYKNGMERVAHYMAKTVSHVVVSVDELDATSDISRGRLVENRRLVGTLIWTLCFRTGLVAALGIWILNKRELGLVIRK